LLIVFNKKYSQENTNNKVFLLKLLKKRGIPHKNNENILMGINTQFPCIHT